MDNINQNLINLIASFKKTGQSDDVIKQSLWQMGMIPEVIESNLEYYNKHTAQVNKDINIVKENKDMKLTLEKLHVQAERAMAALEEMKNDNSLGFSASQAKSIIEEGLNQLQITNDDKTVLEEKIKAGYEIDDTLVNPVTKYFVAESLHNALTSYDWLMPVSDFRGMIAESFVNDKWSYVAANFARSLASNSTNASYASLYESLVDVLIDENNVRHALKNVLLENSWNSDAKALLSKIVEEEKFEQGEIDTTCFENSNCSVVKNISPLIIDGKNEIFNLNGKNYIFNGESLQEATVTDKRYNNVLEGLKLMQYEADKDRLVYYGKNNMVLEYNCADDTIALTGCDNINDMSIIDVNETLKRCGIFNRETIADCEKIVKMFESKDMLCEIDDNITTVKNNRFAGLYVTVISVQEGVYVNKVNAPYGINEMKLYKSAKEACEEIGKFMKYDATKILEDRLKKEGNELAIIESKKTEIKDTLAFLSEKRAEIIQAIQETEENEQLNEALKLVDAEYRKFEKMLQELYMD